MMEDTEIRKCVLTGKTAKKDELLRFVVLPDGRFLPDFDKKLGGRGVYLSNSVQLLNDLVKKEKPLNKILHKNVLISADLPQITENILQKKALEAINLARKAGNLVLGFEKVKEALKKNRAAFVVAADDCGHDGRDKIVAMSKDIEVISIFATNLISEALNHENTVYLAILKGKTDGLVKKALMRYQTFMNE